MRETGRDPWNRLRRIVIEAHLRPFFGGMRADQVTTAVVHRYIAKRQSERKANGTINRELTMLRRAFSYATEVNPPKVGKVPRISKLEEGPPRKGFFELAEYEAMLVALPDEIKPVLTFAFATGCRKGEILGLQWSQVDFLGGVIRLEPGTTKNKEGRTIPLGDELVAMLKMQRQIHDSYHPKSPWVFFRHGTGEQLNDFRGAWAAACKKCGLWDEAKERPTRLLYDLRRTAIRDLTRSGVPERVAMAISGHKTRAVFDRYDIVDEADLRHGINRREAYHRQLRQKAAGRSCTKVGPGGRKQRRDTQLSAPMLLI